MTKISVSVAALMLMAACSATASPNLEAAAAAPSPAVQARAAPVAQPAPAVTAEAPARAAHSTQRAGEPAAAPRAAILGDAVSCDVRARPTADGVLIQAVARAARSFEGDYELVITKSGGGGSSDVTQSGPFSVAAGQSVTLGSTELGADGRYRAVLVLRDGSGEVCRQERRS